MSLNNKTDNRQMGFLLILIHFRKDFEKTVQKRSLLFVKVSFQRKMEPPKTVDRILLL